MPIDSPYATLYSKAITKDHMRLYKLAIAMFVPFVIVFDIIAYELPIYSPFEFL